jgi:hypothetical protein
VAEVLPLTEDTTPATEAKEAKEPKEAKAPRPPRERRERGPPADGIPSKNKVMVANLPYDLSEEKVCVPEARWHDTLKLTRLPHSSRNFSLPTSHPLPRSHSALSPVSW